MRHLLFSRKPMTMKLPGCFGRAVTGCCCSQHEHQKGGYAPAGYGIGGGREIIEIDVDMFADYSVYERQNFHFIHYLSTSQKCRMLWIRTPLQTCKRSGYCLYVPSENSS